MTPFDKEMVARTAFMEASREGREGIRAVVHTVLNRFKAKKWYSAKTLAGVVVRPSQYSCWNTNDPNRLRMAETADDDPTLNLCRSLVNDAANGGEDPTLGCTHYYSTAIAPPDWTKTGQFVVQIGRHKFFRGVA